jgi:hypothetical protein
MSRWTANLCSKRLAIGATFIVAALAVTLAGVAFAQSPSKTKLLPSAKPSDCAACHGKTTPLPKAHATIAGKSLADCRTCHAKLGPMALEGKLSLSHVHQLDNVTCKSCHANVRKPEAPPSTQCLTCHSGDAIFAATSNIKPRNPHGSPHYGKESDCNLCHHQHKKSENFCNECHQFDFKVP